MGVVGVGWMTDLMGRRTLVITVMECLTIPLVSLLWNMYACGHVCVCAYMLWVSLERSALI